MSRHLTTRALSSTSRPRQQPSPTFAPRGSLTLSLSLHRPSRGLVSLGASSFAAGASRSNVIMASSSASVTVVTTTACPYCKRAKKALKDEGVAFSEIDAAANPALLDAIKGITGQKTVPQVFVGGKLVGGQSDLQALIDSKALAALLEEAAGRPALPAAVAAAVEAAGGLNAAASGGGLQGLEDKGEIMELIALEESIRGGGKLEIRDIWQGLSSHSRVFKGSELAEAAGGAERAGALLAAGLVAHVGGGGGFAADGSLYRFHSDAPFVHKGPLNDVGPSGLRSGLSAPQVAELMRAQILELYDEYLSSDGRAVDYDAMGRSAAFRRFARTTAALKEAKVEELTREERIAFFCNVYNALVVHATAARGAPDGVLARLGFFGGIKYVINGLEYSSNDIEHGVLRANSVSPAALATLVGLPNLAPRTFAKGDARLNCIVEPLDPRIHFALVCGAKSCPAIRVYSADGLDEQLGAAAEAFCGGEVAIDVAAREVTTSKIFKWYGRDFTGPEFGGRALLEKVAPWLPADKAAAAGEVLGGGGDVAVKFTEYDWSVNKK